MLRKIFYPLWFKIPLIINFALVISISVLWIYGGTPQQDLKDVNVFAAVFMTIYFPFKYFYENILTTTLSQVLMWTWTAITFITYFIYVTQDEEKQKGRTE